MVPGQGLSLGCLLLPTLATACLHRALLTQPPLASKLTLCTIPHTYIHTVYRYSLLVSDPADSHECEYSDGHSALSNSLP